MNSPVPTPFCPLLPFRGSVVAVVLPFALSLSLAGCGGTVVSKTEAETVSKKDVDAVVPTSIPMWLGNPSRTFYGTGPWSDRPLAVTWEAKTRLTPGRFHKVGWG